MKIKIVLMEKNSIIHILYLILYTLGPFTVGGKDKSRKEKVKQQTGAG